MTVYKHSLADVIACAWWPNDGPVFIRPRPHPFDDELVVKFRPRGAGETKLRQLADKERIEQRKREILAVLEVADSPMSTAQIGFALDSDELASIGGCIRHLLDDRRITEVSRSKSKSADRRFVIRRKNEARASA